MMEGDTGKGAHGLPRLSFAIVVPGQAEAPFVVPGQLDETGTDADAGLIRSNEADCHGAPWYEICMHLVDMFQTRAFR